MCTSYCYFSRYNSVTSSQLRVWPCAIKKPEIFVLRNCLHVFPNTLYDLVFFFVFNIHLLRTMKAAHVAKLRINRLVYTVNEYYRWDQRSNVCDQMRCFFFVTRGSTQDLSDIKVIYIDIRLRDKVLI